MEFTGYDDEIQNLNDNANTLQSAVADLLQLVSPEDVYALVTEAIDASV